jgi:putative transposase
MIDHALNRGNGRAAVFHKPEDHDAFRRGILDACERLPIDVLGYGLMPNHFHLVLRPHGDGDLGPWMQWLLTAHAQRYHRHYGTSGHVWQGRFKAFPIQDDDHLAAVLRYVECNPLRAELVKRAEDWRWSSLPDWIRGDPLLWRGEPPLRDSAWMSRVNEPLSASDLRRFRHSVERGRPFGDEPWTRQNATRLGLESCLRPRGRPRKE